MTFLVDKALEIFKTFNSVIGITSVYVYEDVETKEVKAIIETSAQCTYRKTRFRHH